MAQSIYELAQQKAQQQSAPSSIYDLAKNKALGVNTVAPVEPQKNAFGRAVDPIVEAGKTAVGKIFNAVDTPQNALQGAAVSALQGENPLDGLKAGWNREKDFQGSDVLGAAGWEGDGWGKWSAGLALDLVGDPTNLVGIGPIKKAYQGAVGATALLGEKAIKATPIANKVYNTAEAFLDPHAHLKAVPGLKDSARLWESAARAKQTAVHEEAAAMAGRGLKVGEAPGLFTRSIDQEKLRQMSYAIDKGDLSALDDETRGAAEKFISGLNKQWDSELATKHQGVPTQAPTSTGKIPKNGGAAPKIENYFPYVTKPDDTNKVRLISDVRGTSRFSKPREFTSLEAAKAGGNATDDPVKAYTARLMTGRMAQHGSEVLEEAATKFGSDVAKPGWRKLSIPDEVNLPQALRASVSGKHFPPEAADYLERAHAVFNKPDDVIGAYKNAVKVYKGWLVSNPQQVATNLLGNVVNVVSKGETPSLRNMARSVPVVMNGKLPPAIGNYTSEQIAAGMRKYEIIGGAGQYQDIVDTGKNYSLNPLKANNPISKVAQFANQHLGEEPFKVAQFFHQLEKGKTLEQAALATKDVLFDYAEISPMAKKLRDTGLVPFITWQVKNLPLQIENLAMRPQKFAQTESIMDAVSDDDAIMPHQDIREGMIPLEGDKAFRFASPINDLNKLPIGDYQMKDLALDTIGQSLGLKQLVELTSSGKYPGTQGRKLYNDAPIWRDNQDGTVPYDFISALAQKVGLGGAVGIGENNMGEQTQNELAAYLLQQNPWGYWNRNLPSFGPPDELVQKGAVRDPKDRSYGDIFGDITGFRTKDIKPKDQLTEMQRRMKMILAP